MKKAVIILFILSFIVSNNENQDYEDIWSGIKNSNSFTCFQEIRTTTDTLFDTLYFINH